MSLLSDWFVSNKLSLNLPDFYIIVAFHVFVTGKNKNFKSGIQVDHNKS